MSGAKLQISRKQLAIICHDDPEAIRLMEQLFSSVNQVRVTQGAWTPRVYGTTTDGVGTYTAQGGHYVLIGSVCYFNAYLVWTNHTGTGNIRIDGLPYNAATPANPHTVPCSVYHSGLTLTAGSVLMAHTNSGNKILSIKQISTGGGTAGDVPIDTSVAALLISGFYFIE